MKYTRIHAAKKTDISEHLPTLYRLVVDNGLKTVVELGVREGESTVALLEGVHETKGHLTSVDLADCPIARERIKRYGLSERWTFIRGDDVVTAASWDAGRPIDLVFIDTSHEYEHTQRELEVWEPLVRPWGILAFHDTVTYCHGVWGPISAYIQGRGGYQWTNHPNCNGLGILRKPPS